MKMSTQTWDYSLSMGYHRNSAIRHVFNCDIPTAVAIQQHRIEPNIVICYVVTCEKIVVQFLLAGAVANIRNLKLSLLL